MDAANTCVIRTGRLMEIDVVAGYRTVADVDEMIRMIGRNLAALPATTRAVIVADWRGCRVFSQEVADRARAMLAGASPRVERSAILHLGDQATSVMQVLRLVREANHPGRRLFTDVREMRAFLAEVLDPAEGAALATFLAGRG